MYQLHNPCVLQKKDILLFLSWLILEPSTSASDHRRITLKTTCCFNIIRHKPFILIAAIIRYNRCLPFFSKCFFIKYICFRLKPENCFCFYTASVQLLEKEMNRYNNNPSTYKQYGFVLY